jgi:hypothetical protein
MFKPVLFAALLVLPTIVACAGADSGEEVGSDEAAQRGVNGGNNTPRPAPGGAVAFIDFAANNDTFKIRPDHPANFDVILRAVGNPAPAMKVLSPLPNGMFFVNESSVQHITQSIWVWRPTRAQIGNHDVLVELSNGRDSVRKTFHLVVLNTPTTPGNVVVKNPGGSTVDVRSAGNLRNQSGDFMTIGWTASTGGVGPIHYEVCNAAFSATRTGRGPLLPTFPLSCKNVTTTTTTLPFSVGVLVKAIATEESDSAGRAFDSYIVN